MSERGVGRERIDNSETERFRSLRKPLGLTSFGLNQMTMLPGQRGRIHRHEHQEEVFLVLEGTLTVELEGAREPLELDAGELLRIAPELKRQLSNQGSETVQLIAIGGYGNHEGRDGIAFTDWDQLHGAPPQEVPLPEDLPS